jgi:Flp pilus assembly protein TadD
MADKMVRTASGVWKVDTSPPEPPKAAAPSAPRATGTPSRGLPSAQKDRATVMVDLARADLAKGNLGSAETNLRLALSFSPGNAEIEAELRHLAESREAARRAKGPDVLIK